MDIEIVDEPKRWQLQSPKVGIIFAVVVIVICTIIGFVTLGVMKDLSSPITEPVVPKQVVALDLSTEEKLVPIKGSTTGSQYWYQEKDGKWTATIPEDTPSGDYAVKVGGKTVVLNVENPDVPKVFSLYIGSAILTNKGLELQIVNGGTGLESIKVEVELRNSEGELVGKPVRVDAGEHYDHTSSTILLKQYKKVKPGEYFVSTTLKGSKEVTLEFLVIKEETK